MGNENVTYWGLENLLKKPTDKITVKISLIYLINRTNGKIEHEEKMILNSYIKLFDKFSEKNPGDLFTAGRRINLVILFLFAENPTDPLFILHFLFFPFNLL